VREFRELTCAFLILSVIGCPGALLLEAAIAKLNEDGDSSSAQNHL